MTHPTNYPYNHHDLDADPPMWIPKHIRALMQRRHDAREKASLARRDVERHTTVNIMLEIQPKTHEHLILQQVLRAYEDEITALTKRIRRELLPLAKSLELGPYIDILTQGESSNTTEEPTLPKDKPKYKRRDLRRYTKK